MALTIKDLREVSDAVFDIRSKWYYIGLDLGLIADTLDNIRRTCDRDPGECLLETLKIWLRTGQSEQPPTWEKLVAALRVKAVGEDKIAADLEAKYIRVSVAGDETSSGNRQDESMDQIKSLQEENLDLKKAVEKKEEEIQQLKRKRKLEQIERGISTTVDSDYHGIELTKKIRVTVLNGDPQRFELHGTGLTLCIPERALPSDVPKTNLIVGISLTGQYHVERDYELCSAVYWILADVKFCKPVTLEMQHSAIPGPDNTLKFAIAKQPQPGQPISFNIIDGGVFSPESQNATLAVDGFSGFAVIMPRGHPQYYRSQIWYERDKASFIVTRDLDAEIDAVENFFMRVHGVPGPSTRLEFESNQISLDLPKEGIKTQQWKIVPLYAPFIRKDEINSFRGRRKDFPMCEISMIICTAENEELLHTYTSVQPHTKVIDLIGAKPPRNYIVLELSPSKRSRYNALIPMERKGRYVAHILYTATVITSWTVFFIITPEEVPIEYLSKSIDVKCQPASLVRHDYQKIGVESNQISLDIPEEGLQLGGWKIIPLFKPTIDIAEVNAEHESDRGFSTTFPSCSLLIQWSNDKEPHKPVDLEHRVRIWGVMEPFDYFILTCSTAMVPPRRIVSGAAMMPQLEIPFHDPYRAELFKRASMPRAEMSPKDIQEALFSHAHMESKRRSTSQGSGKSTGREMSVI